ncbi:2,4-dienoyl-CoA reductase-like NADH-dependent reductase (Old Yellow Enzyme family) [Microbacterium sp. SLBN-154]|uniref:NADH:flavin oxidoreductase/NADH oxidase n=1 Tax=Microbacterium sp. SLBN-154 TaxID=2768458 RepID=UPI00114EEE57|nr:NADH:flavin oxidoreductase/NADH oxidase [Microbacterium sp. SLBN-154]TQK20304.1 2,4-dienoyl-CoA reductase-like NADH-dependent reductase (Old Yellow Enzyme family) [Microbacterium sp. SLBN-154]
MTSPLFRPLTVRGITLANRIVMAPMCQYSADPDGPDVGAPNDWHVQHYGSRSLGRPGLIIVEATAVSAEGRISAYDLGIWNDTQVAAHRRLTRFFRDNGVAAGIQLAHAGRKASSPRPFDGPFGSDEPAADWQPVAPSAVAFAPDKQVPTALDRAGIDEVIGQFATAARRAREAGYDVIEIHAAHGYLLHEFLSPVSNTRTDDYGGSFENRVRILEQVTDAVRQAVGDRTPIFVRISATDWVEPAGWTADDSVRLAGLLRERGVDVVHVSTGGNVADAQIPVGPGYQVPFSRRIRQEAHVLTAAVGLIRDPEQAEEILDAGDADLVALAREFLLDPLWPVTAARHLGEEWSLAPQYERAEILARRDARTSV